MAHSGAEILFSLSFELPRFYSVNLLRLYLSWQVRLILPEHLPSFARRLIVCGGHGGFMVRTETSGRSAFPNLLGSIIPSLHIVYRGLFAVLGCTKHKQKRFFLCSLNVFTVLSYF